MNGLDRLLSRSRLPRAGARVGCLGHAASVDARGVHGVERLLRRGEWRLVRLFSPEHGFDAAGGAGEPVADARHPVWNLPVHSLYGEHRAPPPEWLDDLDLVVTDLRDLGVRCYTYASTLQNVLRACAAAGVPVRVLDRATPLEGITDGPDLNPALRSFVGQVDLPLVYGWGQGRLARFLRDTDPACAGLELEVEEADPFCDADRWTPPSPAIPTPDAARLYPTTVWCEAVPGVRVDRGGMESFQRWGMEGLDAARIVRNTEWEGVRAEAVSQDTLRFTVDNPAKNRPAANAVRLLAAVRDQFGAARLFAADGASPDFFDRLMGTRDAREALERGAEAGEIIRGWKRDFRSS